MEPPLCNRIMIVDDHPLVREGLSAMLDTAKDMQVIFAAGSLKEARSALQKLRPDLILLDISLGDGNGLDFIKDIHAQISEQKILILSINEESIYAERAIRAGARGYIMKDAPLNKLLEAIRKVIAGDIAVSEAIVAQTFQRMAAGKNSAHGLKDKASPQGILSDRELEIYALIGQGKKTSEISGTLSISPRTVDTHKGRIKEKLGLSDQHALIRHAINWTK